MPILPLLAATLVLNEVLYDPPGADAGREFVEIYNASDVEVPIAGLVLETGDGARPGIWRRAWEGTHGALAPGAILLVGADSVAALERWDGRRRMSASSWASFTMRHPAVTGVALTRRKAGTSRAMPSENAKGIVSSMPTRPVAPPSLRACATMA